MCDYDNINEKEGRKKMRKMKKVMAVALASAMALAMNVSTAFAASTTQPTVTTVDNGDGTANVVISVNGDLAEFDYEIVYDSSKATPTKLKYNSEFIGDYVMNGVATAQDMKVCPVTDKQGNPVLNEDGTEKTEDKGEYITVGGTYSKGYTWNDVLFTATFKINDPTAQFAVVVDQSKFTDETGKNLTMSEDIAKAAAQNFVAQATPTPDPVTPVPENPTSEAPETSSNPNVTVAPTDGTVVNPTTTPATDKPDSTIKDNNNNNNNNNKTTAAPTTAPTTAPTIKSNSAKTGDTANVVIPFMILAIAGATLVVSYKKKKAFEK